ncbi:hypothetical protein TYRP_022672 [Tyrophagus putrescentiae]|nr:hypothetical protein TYRP_022672 [Tyrophagus putrescentiae]
MGSHNSGVTYTRFHLPDPNELITGDPPSSSVSGAAPHLPGVIYRLESPTLIGGHHHHHPLPGPPMNELPKTTSGKKKSKKRKNKSKNKAVTKLTLNPYVATTADPNQFGNNNNSPYSVNKIIVIEEDGAVGIGPPPGLVESSQIERPQLTSEIQHQNQQNLKDTFQPVHRVHFPPPQNRPQNVQTIKTIKDLHDQLNVSLFQNQNQQQETQTTTMSPIIAELIEKLNSGNSAGVPPTTTTTPLFKNNSTLENSALASKHFTGSSGYFVKANRFQFQNSWTSTEAPPTSSSTTAVTPPVVYFTSQRNFAPTPAKTTPQPPSPSPSTSTTIITSTPTPTTLGRTGHCEGDHQS